MLFFLYIFVPIQFFPCYIHSIALKPIDFFFGFFGCNIFYYIFAVVSLKLVSHLTLIILKYFAHSLIWVGTERFGRLDGQTFFLLTHFIRVHETKRALTVGRLSQFIF